MIVGISGHMLSGKDTVAKMIQYFTSEADQKCTFQQYLRKYDQLGQFSFGYLSNWEIKKFADRLKDIVCLLIGCTREQLEDQKFKNTELGEEWNKWKVINNSHDEYGQSYYSSKEEAEYSVTENGENWHYYKPAIELIKLTPRLLLQLIGTECGRNIIHPDVWVNSLMVDYKPIDRRTWQDPDDSNITIPKWLITDIRFPNEVKAIRNREGIIIRIERPGTEKSDHYSETALDDYKDWDEVIVNDGTMDDLLEKVKLIVSKYNL